MKSLFGVRAWFRSGTPWIWLNAGAIALCLVMVVGVLGLIVVRGGSHFWPADLQQTEWAPESGQKKLFWVNWCALKQCQL
ncbi:hypothetical protein JAMGFMIE_03460 [Rheinheimera sp. MM224]|nr:hypothetical protein JAMGFMIE_03460 [Rheinheimera sp. MM224]